VQGESPRVMEDGRPAHRPIFCEAVQCETTKLFAQFQIQPQPSGVERKMPNTHDLHLPLPEDLLVDQVRAFSSFGAAVLLNSPHYMCVAIVAAQHLRMHHANTYSHCTPHTHTHYCSSGCSAPVHASRKHTFSLHTTHTHAHVQTRCTCAHTHALTYKHTLTQLSFSRTLTCIHV